MEKTTAKTHVRVLCPEGDEYEQLYYDKIGETKVTSTGYLLGDRRYRCPTFTLRDRGDKRFMSAMDCARILGFPSVLHFFQWNPYLYQLRTTREQRKELVPRCNRSTRRRFIRYFDKLVTAKSVFCHFGHRIILNGRPGRDDYSGEEPPRLVGDEIPESTMSQIVCARSSAVSANDEKKEDKTLAKKKESKAPRDKIRKTKLRKNHIRHVEEQEIQVQELIQCNYTIIRGINQPTRCNIWFQPHRNETRCSLHNLEPVEEDEHAEDASAAEFEIARRQEEWKKLEEAYLLKDDGLSRGLTQRAGHSIIDLTGSEEEL